MNNNKKIRNPYPFNTSNIGTVLSNDPNDLDIFLGKPYYCGDDKKRGMGHKCCFNHIIGLPTKLGIEHPIYDYELDVIDKIEHNRNIWIKKSSGIGCTELILRYLLFKILVDDSLLFQSVFIVSGTFVAHAHELKVRMENMFRGLYPSLKLQSKFTELWVKNTNIKIFPSRNVKDLRGYTNVAYLFIDEGDFFQDSVTNELLHAITRYEEKSHCTTIMVSTPNAPGGLYEQIEKDQNSKYKKILLPYQLGLDKIYNREEILAKMSEPEFEREYNLQYTGRQGNTFNIVDIDESLKRFSDLKIANIPTNQGGVYFVGIDPASGSSKTAIVVTQRLKDPNCIRILYSDEYVKPSSAEIVSLCHSIRLKYGVPYTYFFIDASAPMLIRDIKVSMGEDPNYDLKDISVDNSHVIPVVFGSEHRQMLSNLEYLVNRGYFAIDPKYEKVIISLKTAYSTDWKLDKTTTSFDDTLDALRLSCKGYKVTEKEI